MGRGQIWSKSKKLNSFMTLPVTSNPSGKRLMQHTMAASSAKVGQRHRPSSSSAVSSAR
jgi:hypothetical protein